jgi:hypothetical protein
MTSLAMVQPIAIPRRIQTPCLRSLDGLPWTRWAVVTRFGSRVGIRVDQPDLMDVLLARLPEGVRQVAAEGTVDRLISVVAGDDGERKGVRRLSLVYLNHVPIARERGLEAVLDAFDTQLRFAIAQFARRRIVVHGGAVAWDGNAILIPGSTHSGKSHLVAALLRAGATYITDEHIVLNDAGMVCPWTKPLAIRGAPGERQTYRSAESFGATEADRPAPVGLILGTRYQEGAVWRPRPVSSSDGALLLLQNTIAARMYPQRVLRVLSAAARGAPVMVSDRPDAAEVVEDIRRLLDPAFRERLAA